MKTDKPPPKWAEFYRVNKATVKNEICRRCHWVEPDEAKSLTNDAFVAALNRDLPYDSSHTIRIVTGFALRRAYSLLRKNKRLRRNRGVHPAMLDTVAPSGDTDVPIPPRVPEPFLRAELARYVAKYSLLQQLVAYAMMEYPESPASEIADIVAPALGRRPSNKVVERSQKEIRRKLRPFLCLLKRELRN